MSKKSEFLAVLCAANIITVLVVFILLFLFREAAVSLPAMLLRAGIPGLVYILLSTLILGRNARFFDAGNFAVSGEAYAAALKKIGAVPVKMIAFLTVLENILLGGIFVQGPAAGIRAEMGTALYLVCLSLGLLAGTFVYVLTDRLVSKTLITCRLAQYPRELREGRQSVKMLIIPIAVALIAILYNLSVTLLVITRAGGSLPGMEREDWLVMAALIAFFVVFVFILALTLKKGTSGLFDSVIEQLENLSSAKKDLTRRISICSVDEVGTISGMVNGFCENIGAGMRDIKGGQKELASSGFKLEENASGMAASLARISEAVEQIRLKVEEQQQSVAQSSAAVQQIAKNIESLDGSISTQSASMSQASAAVEEMVGNIASIGGVTGKMAAQFKTVGEAAAAGGAIQ
ncbi:MAG: methyl-accepting chemotaxis protein, partial [Treponema sp.]|nr:methyl-accepting chemotaxis protein [Treponema sp.]